MKHINFREMHQAVIESNVDRKMKIKCHDVVNKMNNEYNKQEVNVLWSKIKKYWLIAWFSMIFLMIVVWSILNYAEAKENKICKSDKCEARYNRIVTCQKYTKNKDDVLQCALWKTVFLRKDWVDRHEKEEIKEELRELMEKMWATSDTLFEDLKEFVKKWEWSFQEKAFCDSYYKSNWRLIRHPSNLCTRWSIGFWTISYQWEKITYDEAVKRKAEDLKQRMSLIKSDCLTNNQLIVVVDFMYQHWSYSSNIIKNVNKCDTEAIYNTFTHWRDVYKAKKYSWMVKREQLRINLFNQK